MAYSILVVDDDPHIREIICFALKKAGMTTTEAGDGAMALNRFAANAPNLIVLDIGMPEMDGLEVCRQIRRTSEVAILFLSARDEEIDRVLGLEIGGDDYVTKPFSPRELVARVNTILKRINRRPTPDTVKPLRHGALRLDPDTRIAQFADADLTLTALEFAILKTLLGAPARVFNREQILEFAYPGPIHVSDRTIDSHIRNIRAKLAEAGCASAIETVHGVGFRLGRCEIAT